MPELSELGQRFRQRLKTVDGRHFYGAISLLPETSGRGNVFYTPRRVLNVRPSCGITSGMLIYDTSGRVMLTAWAGDDEAQGTFSTLFKLFDLDHQLVWSRSVTTKDAVTGLSKQTTTLQSLGTFWGTLELLSQDLNSLSALSRYRVLCNTVLKIGDIINKNKTVRRIEYAMGITIAEVA
ncbi:hypothetical protein [Telmatospirillum sp.]|uniref:hypothetical protein n=1 Tax=Telmatospirillum sp. TaxID=2079197 RepID=UPI00284174DB|nr:hypothetical protein [Telmatospirillum sp.]MDR3436431.1 hypothetical protein [Telmatospirillum sp.]